MSHNPAGEGRGRGLNDYEVIQRNRNPTPAELADRIEAWVRGGSYKLDDPLPSSLRASIGDLMCAHLPMLLAALRAVPEPAGRQALAAVEDKP